ncbi:MAG: hypothetical protein FJ276_22350, partial [Planctomycetes bacterium]|nr:hypothetical protein [Planctomycetota bacterium]
QPDIEPFERTVFFTDRALYRPGQTIRFKGICVAVDQQRDNYRTLAGKTVTVVFQDANGQEIAQQPCKTNQVGSLSGSFTAPRDRLAGRMTIRDQQRDGSEAWFNVEEYKRPKFKVDLAAPADPARLDARVVVKGTAKAYTGAAIDGAKVQYRVVREVRYPVWWYWRCWWNPPSAGPQEIVHGTAKTDTDGSFEIAFAAKPDPSVAEKDEPVFQFTIHADVTDTSGETRSDERSVNVGYTALQASLSANEWQTVEKAVDVVVSTQSLDGEPLAAKGTLRVHQLQQPAQVQRPAVQEGYRPWFLRGDRDPEPDPSNPNSWPLGPVVADEPFATDATGTVTKSFHLEAGAYRAVLQTQDAFGRNVTAVQPIKVLDPAADRFAIKIANLVTAPEWSIEPGKTFMALWGTGYEEGRAFVEVEHRGKTVQSYWTQRGATQATIEQAVGEAMRGGFSLHVTQVRENRAHLFSQKVNVPWSNKRLQVQWEHFVSKLAPGQQETWRVSLSGPNAEKAAAEMVAALYDASLDAYLPHNWPDLELFRQDYSRVSSQFENQALSLRGLHGNFQVDRKPVEITYRELPHEVTAQLWGFQAFGANRRMAFGAPGAARGRGMMMEGQSGAPEATMALEAAAAPAPMMDMAGMGGGVGLAKEASTGLPGPRPVDLDIVSARKNLNETAFFFPHLVADAEGKVTIEFTMPEALTEWKFLGFAHDSQLRHGAIVDKAVTSKDLMVQPMPPRFVREGDVIEFTVKVTNQSPARQTGTVRLTLADARTLDSVDSQLGNAKADQEFDIPAGQSRSFSWRLEIPDGMGFMTYKAVGSTGRISDGEEGYLPVLARRILVAESLPLPIRGATTKDFQFAKLLESAGSDTLRHQSLTVQMVSNPAWYAVMALPYLMEYPYECTEQTFNRLYANALARHIANADPKIRRVFDQWKGTPALDSPLQQNEDLKSVLLEETPWVRDAQRESEARRNVGVLFDANRLNDETAMILRKLVELQLEDGAWPWFPGGRANDYITLYIVTGFGRLRHLGTDIDVSPAVKALTSQDSWIDRTYREILRRGDKGKIHLSETIALYLYGRSFFLEDMPIAAEHQEAVNYFLDQARQYWLQLANRQSQAHLAIALKRFGDNKVPQDIMVSIKERSVENEELGMFWRETELSWWWYRAPIETQAMMIEAFDEVMSDAESVESCRVWLLKQKQTQDWKTTKATADAVYALLLRGTDMLASDALVQVSLGGIEVRPERVEAGTGFYQQRFLREEVKPDMGSIKVTKTDPGVAWGSVHWQYLEDMSKVTPYEGTPLTLKKKLYVKENTAQGPVLKPVDGPISVGDELVVRIELRVDRDMEYVHLKDQRGCGVEPVDVLSHYRFQDGLAYYQSTRDTASHFFIDYLPKGTYVFEYSTRVVHRGKYKSGMAQIQCMYAPEFNSHSESFELAVE